MVWSDTDNDICDRKFYTKRMEIDIVMDGRSGAQCKYTLVLELQN